MESSSSQDYTIPIYKPRRRDPHSVVSSSMTTDDGKSFCQRTSLNSSHSAESDAPTISKKTTKKSGNIFGVFSSPSAKNRRSLYALSRKCAQSLPSAAESVISSSQRYSSDFFKQFSLESVAMQNNCTVLNNKVRPVVIKNCKEEYQLRQYQYLSSGKLHEEFSEHELLLDRFFLLKDHFVGIDVHNTMEEHGVPNLKMSTVGTTLYAIGQPTLNGLEKFSAFLSSKYKSVCYINVRAVPTLFLRRSGDFIPYSGYCLDENFKRQMRLTERQLHDSEREMQLQALQIASKNSDLFYFYNVLDQSPDEPHMYYIKNVADIVTSRQMYSKIQSERQNFKYKRLVLHDINTPPFTWMDSLMDILNEMELASKTGDNAIVFQGLTGEGSARLAMIMAYIALSINVKSESNAKSKRRIQSIHECFEWREVILHQLLESASLGVRNLQHKVDEAIASACTPVVILAFIRETRKERQESNVELVLGGLPKHINVLAEESNPVQQNEKSDLLKVREIPNSKSVASSFSLRDVSELSLPSSHRIESRHGEGSLDENKTSITNYLHKHISKTPLRYEVCDEICLLKRLFHRPDLYFYLVLFQAYIIKKAQGGVGKFSEWMVNHPNLILTLSQAKQYSRNLAKETIWEMNAKSIQTNCQGNEADDSFHRVVGVPIYGMGQALPERFAKVITSLCGVEAKKRFKRVIFLNLRNEMSFYTLKQSAEETVESQTNSNSHSSRSPSTESDHTINPDTLWELQHNAIPAMHGAPSHMIEAVESQLTEVVNRHPERIVLIRKYLPSDRELVGEVKSTSAVIKQLANLPEVKEVCEHVGYTRIPLFFDQMIATLRDSYQENPDTAFVFFCHNGKKRSTNMMVAACLVLGHMNGFPSNIENALSSTVESYTPDDEFTRGEFKLVLELLQILPNCYIRKQEVDIILDLCHESMSTMHYHLRENLNPSYKKISKAKTVEESVTLKHRCIQGLEFYVILIVFNYYLKQEKLDLWRSLSFNEWMSKHGSRLGVCQLLNNFGVMDFNQDEPLNKMQSRWSDTSTVLCNILGEDSIPGLPRKNLKEFRTASMSTESFDSTKWMDP